MKYAGFWKRFLAGLIDFFVLLVPILLLGWLSSISQLLAILLAFPLGLLYWFYEFSLHAATGHTIVKRTVGIRVVHLDGSRTGRSEAFRRSAVDLLFAVIWIVGTIWGVSTLSSVQFSNDGWLHQWDLIQNSQPFLFAWADVASQVWIWSEVVTMLFNRKRRAIHDFTAGTVVVEETRS